MAMAWQLHPKLPLVLAANRDEFHDRESAPMAWWEGQGILAGRDLRAGGTWLGLSQTGRIALLTNVREPGKQDPQLPSRGALVPMWLQGAPAAPEMAQRLRAMPANGYNLLGIDLMAAQAHCWSNRHGHRHALAPGLYGLSNAALDTPWPKLIRLKRMLDEACRQPDRLSETLMQALSDRQLPSDELLPQTGLSTEWERWLSSIFIETPHRRYGTRCSTVIVVEQQTPQEWRVHTVEQGWDAQGQASGRVEQSWTVTPSSAPGA
ncbi:MAG: NRDE family protein [Burkholderiales bacterium]|nr:NRDE family protein [Burkholderiales bacterium]